MIPSWKTMRSTKLISPTKFLLVVMGVIVAIQIISYKIYDGSFRSRNETTDERKFLEALLPRNTNTVTSSINNNQSENSKQTFAGKESNVKTDKTNTSNYVATKTESGQTTPKVTHVAIQIEKRVPQVIIVGAQKGVCT